jgi:hypothetical protein
MIGLVKASSLIAVGTLFNRVARRPSVRGLVLLELADRVSGACCETTDAYK